MNVADMLNLQITGGSMSVHDRNSGHDAGAATSYQQKIGECPLRK